MPIHFVFRNQRIGAHALFSTAGAINVLSAAVTKLTYDAIKFVWGALTSSFTEGAPIPEFYADYSERTVEVDGVWDGATFMYQGSNRGSVFNTLTDDQGNVIAKTADAIELVTERSGLQKPVVSGCGATTSLYCTVIARRNKFT